MEIIDSIWQVGLIALLAGAMIGALAYRFFSPSVRQADEVKSELDHARRQLSDYKANVNSHFAKTSELVNDLTHNYVKVYQHLAEGAQTLGDSRALNNLLEQQQGKVLLAVDDESEVARTAAGSVQPEPGPKAEEPAASADDADEQAAGASAAEDNQPQDREEKSATAAAPMSDAASRDPEAPPEEPERADESVRASKTDDEAGDGEPVLDVSRIDGKGAAAAEDDPTPGVAAVIPEPGESEGVKPTRH